MLEEMTEIVLDYHQDQHPSLDQVQELVLTEIESGIASVGNMITLQVNAQTLS